MDVSVDLSQWSTNLLFLKNLLELSNVTYTSIRFWYQKIFCIDRLDEIVGKYQQTYQRKIKTKHVDIHLGT